MSVKCEGKHVKAEVPEKHFNCPKCGAEVGVFCVESSEWGFDCPLLHDDDELRCSTCHYTTDGKSFSAAYARKNNLVTCPTCHGCGTVSRGKKK